MIIAVTASACILILYLLPFFKFQSRSRILPIILCTSVILSGIFTYFGVTARIHSSARLDGTVVNGEITVLDVEYTSEYLSSYTVIFNRSEPKVAEKVSLTLEDASVSRGDVFEGSFILNVLSEDEKTEYYKNGVFLTAEAEEIDFIEHDENFSFSSFFKELNKKLCRILKGKHGNGSLASAVLLGDRDGLDAVVKRDFSRLGIYHLLALSGLHLSVLVSALNGLLEKTQLKVPVKSVIKIAGIILYMALTGFSVSVVRAGVMHIVAVLASCVYRDADPFTSLSMSAVLILLFDPTSVFDAGLLLSVLAAYGCITLASLKTNRIHAGAPIIIRILRYVCDIFILTVFINLITLPVIWLTFGEISLVSPIVNVVFIPAITLLLVMSALTLIICKIPVVSQLLLAVLHFTEGMIVKTASALSYLPGITVSLRHAGIGIFIILMFLSLIFLAFSKRKTRIYLTLSASVCVIGIIITSSIGSVIWDKSCDIQYSVLGRSEAIVLRDGTNFTVIDVSDGTHSMSYTVTDMIRKSKGCEIDTLILTHYEHGHISAVPYMADRMIIRNVLLPKATNEDEDDICKRLTESLSERHICVTKYERRAGGSYSNGRISAKFYPIYYYEDDPHPIITLFFTVGNKKLAYAGSGSNYADPEFNLYAENADIIIIGTHPPKGDGSFYPYVTGTVVAHKKVLTDDFLPKLYAADEIKAVENKEVYQAGPYIPLK